MLYLSGTSRAGCSLRADEHIRVPLVYVIQPNCTRHRSWWDQLVFVVGKIAISTWVVETDDDRHETGGSALEIQCCWSWYATDKKRSIEMAWFKSWLLITMHGNMSEIQSEARHIVGTSGGSIRQRGRRRGQEARSQGRWCWDCKCQRGREECSSWRPRLRYSKSIQSEGRVKHWESPSICLTLWQMSCVMLVWSYLLLWLDTFAKVHQNLQRRKVFIDLQPSDLLVYCS